MPELPKKKVGIVACSGEELPEGTITRLAALKVLEQLRPGDTVTICLPLFLAGGAGDRAFARFYPTIAIDGCDQRCAERATALYSSPPAASVLVKDVIDECGLDQPVGRRRLNAAGQQAVDALADRVAERVDELLGRRWNRSTGTFENAGPSSAPESEATCSCGSNIPIQHVSINGQRVALVGLPLIFQQFRESGKAPDTGMAAELLATVKIYNAVPAEEDETYRAILLQEYRAYCQTQEKLG
ncbi:MAG TPA: putative zinc-binding protein [Anaerolineae bacterium]|nr:putative zinc-binding protein [Anaerolineae bacterium]